MGFVTRSRYVVLLLDMWVHEPVYARVEINSSAPWIILAQLQTILFRGLYFLPAVTAVVLQPTVNEIKGPGFKSEYQRVQLLDNGKMAQTPRSPGSAALGIPRASRSAEAEVKYDEISWLGRV